jgi:ribosomal protein S6--L-glutamate ligase
MDKLRVGLYIPAKPPENVPSAIHAAGIGRIPAETQRQLMILLYERDDVEIVADINFMKTIIKDGKVYYSDLCLNELDMFFWYCKIDRNIGSYSIEVLKTLALDTKVIIDPIGFEIGLDKYTAHLALRRAGVRVAETILFDHSNIQTIESVVNEWGAAILKPRLGSFGKGVALLNSYFAVRDVLEYIESTTGGSPDRAFLLERYYENDAKNWVSTTIVNGKIMYGYRKRPSKIVKMGPQAYKIYDENKIGGEVDICELSDEHREEAIKAFHALGAQIMGFDMILHNGLPIIVDENTFAGFYPSLFVQAKKNPAHELYKLISDEIDKFKKNNC